MEVKFTKIKILSKSQVHIDLTLSSVHKYYLTLNFICLREIIQLSQTWKQITFLLSFKLKDRTPVVRGRMPNRES